MYDLDRVDDQLTHARSVVKYHMVIRVNKSPEFGSYLKEISTQ